MLSLLGIGVIYDLIEFLYGAAYLPSVPMSKILLLGVVFYGMNNIVSNYLAATDLPWASVLVWGVALVVNILLNILLVPDMGGIGAALASVITYVCVFLGQCYLVFRSN